MLALVRGGQPHPIRKRSGSTPDHALVAYGVDGRRRRHFYAKVDFRRAVKVPRRRQFGRTNGRSRTPVSSRASMTTW